MSSGVFLIKDYRIYLRFHIKKWYSSDVQSNDKIEIGQILI